jgi:hypothetical protein
MRHSRRGLRIIMNITAKSNHLERNEKHTCWAILNIGDQPRETTYGLFAYTRMDKLLIHTDTDMKSLLWTRCPLIT